MVKNPRAVFPQLRDIIRFIKYGNILRILFILDRLAVMSAYDPSKLIAKFFKGVVSQVAGKYTYET